MMTKCPVCGTEVTDSASTKCIYCSFPFIKTNSGKSGFDSIVKNNPVQERIKEIEDWGRNLYNLRFSKIALIYNLITDLNNFLKELQLLVFQPFNQYNLDQLHTHQNKGQDYYKKLIKLIHDLKKNNDELAQVQQVNNSVEVKNYNNLQITQDAEQITNFSTQLEQEIRRQIASLQTQLEQELKHQLSPLYNQSQQLASVENQLQEIKKLLFQQNNINQSNTVLVSDEAMQLQQHQHETTQYSKQTEELPQESTNIISEQNKTSIVDLPHISWLKAYNQNPESFEKHQPLPLSITDESIHQCRLGVSQPIVLESKKKGNNYWAFPIDSNTSTKRYLVPRANLKLNEYSLELIKFLFTIQEETFGDYNKLKVIYPALVSQIEQDKWQLEAPGILRFESN